MFSSVFAHSEWQGYSKTTTDATATTIKSISVPASKTVLVQAEVTGQNSDISKWGTFKMAGSFYRTASGNVTIGVASPHNVVVEKADGTTIDVTLVANTTNNTVDVKVTGEASETFRWKVYIRYKFAN